MAYHDPKMTNNLTICHGGLMTTYRLLALDMDGTLLDSQKRVSPNTRKALERLAKQGVAIAFATGRNALELGFYSDNLPFIRFGVLSTGSVLYDFAKKVTLDTAPFPVEAVTAAVGATLDEGGLPFLSCVDKTYARQCDIDRLADYDMGGYQLGYEQICTRIDDPLTWIATHPDQVTKLDLFYRNQASMQRARAAIIASGAGVELADCEQGRALEGTAAGVTKGTGLCSLAKHLGIPLNEVVAVGDDGNDLAMLRVVGMPVAMENACSEARAAARCITTDNDHDGVAQVIEKLFF